MTEIISHYKYSQVTANLIKHVTNESDGSESQCYAMACLGVLWLCRGEAGRNKILSYCQILQELSNLSAHYPSYNYLELINNILSNKLPPELIKNIKDIDKDFTILKILPISAVIHYLFFSPELKPEFPEILSSSRFADQDFIKSEHLLNEINNDDRLIMKLNQVFPNYRTITGQSFKDDYKLIESQWKCENGNIIKEFSNMTLTKNGLKKFCIWLKETIKAEPVNLQYKHIQMIISISGHAISLQYDENTEKWYIIDSLNLSDKNIKYGLNDNEMLDELFSYLSYNSNNITFSCAFILDKNININNITLEEFIDKHNMLMFKLNNGSNKFIISNISDATFFLLFNPEYKFEVLSDLLDRNDKVIKTKEDAFKVFYLLDKSCVNNQNLIGRFIKLLSSEELTVSHYQFTEDDELIITDKILSNIYDKNTLINIMQLLCINPNLKNEKDETLLILAIKDKNDKAIEVLIDHPDINYNTFNKFGRNALHFAAAYGNIGLVKTLLIKNISMLDAQDNTKWTALHYAAVNDYLDIVISLLDAGANADIRNDNGKSPLMLAIEKKYEKTIQAMVKHPSMNLNACDNNGCTALHLAVKNNYLNLVKILIAAGANPDIKDNTNNTPVQIAKDNGLTDILEIFKELAENNLKTSSHPIKTESVSVLKLITLFNNETTSKDKVEQPVNIFINRY